MLELSDTRLVVAVLDAYVDWWEEEDRVREAYRRWTQARKTERLRMHAAYAAALDREERACQLYAEAIARYRRRHGAGLPAAG